MNEDQLALFDAIIQHQAYLYRLSTQAVNDVYSGYSDKSSAFALQLRTLLDELTDSEKTLLSQAQYTTPTLKEVRDLINQWQDDATNSMQTSFATSGAALSAYEISYTAKLYQSAIKESIVNGTYKKIVKLPMAGGALIDQLFLGVLQPTRNAVENAIRDGINTGKTNYDIIKNIRGYDKTIDGNKVHFDGILDRAKPEIEKLVRTSRSHISNQSYLETYKQIGVEYVKFISVIDGRTSKLCAGLDGTVWAINDQNKRVPPLHYHCRSVIVPVSKDGELPSVRPYVMDNRAVKNIPKDERDGKIGNVDSNVTFVDFFNNRASKEFQMEWLGATRYKLYSEGKLSITKFFDPQGGFYTINELRVLDNKVFKSLGL